uniref:Reverse transcriptase zinc-binding domain-containing protein n=1 Tax=Aegilops tauschii subsp. strangulata TaxID=200361 RepID=A0A453HI60_AEGTS
DHTETIKHLFLECPLAKLLWRSIHIAFNVHPPTSINTLFGTWLNGVDLHTAKHIRIVICALLWAIWNTRNDVIFNGTKFMKFLQVIYRATTWICMWSLLTHVDSRELLVTGCNRLEMVAWTIFSRFG